MMKKLKQTKNNWIHLASTIGLVLCAGIGIFVIMQFRSAWQGPVITVNYPLAGQTVHDPVVLISGTTHNIAQLNIFGAATPIQLKTNTFVSEQSVPPGISEIILDGYTRSGRHTRTVVPILYTPPQPGQPISPTLEVLRKNAPIETPFRPTSDLLEEVQ